LVVFWFRYCFSKAIFQPKHNVKIHHKKNSKHRSLKFLPHVIFSAPSLSLHQRESMPEASNMFSSITL
jgi:hypothetical protein